MKNFWVGVLVGTLGTLLVCAVLGFSFNMVAARQSSAKGDLPPSPIVWRGIFGSRGEFGVVEELGERSLVLAARDGDKKTLAVGDDTEIFRGKTKITLKDLSKGERILVVAAPQADGTLKAKFIRVAGSSMNYPYPIPEQGFNESPRRTECREGL